MDVDLSIAHASSLGGILFVIAQPSDRGRRSDQMADVEQMLLYHFMGECCIGLPVPVLLFLFRDSIGSGKSTRCIRHDIY